MTVGGGEGRGQEDVIGDRGRGQEAELGDAALCGQEDEGRLSNAELTASSYSRRPNTSVVIYLAGARRRKEVKLRLPKLRLSLPSKLRSYASICGANVC